MTSCARCKTTIPEASRFCLACGTPTSVASQANSAPGQPGVAPPTYLPPAHQASVQHKDFTQMFALDPRIAALTIAVDTMMFGTEVATLGAGIVLSIPVGVVLGIVTYKAQRHWSGDDHHSALIKGLTVGVLTAIPTSLPGFLTIPSGLMGLARLLPKRKKVGQLV